MKQYKQSLDGNGRPVAGSGWSDFIDTMFLGITTAEHYHIPTAAKKVRLTGTTAFWVKMNGETAAIATTEVADGTGSFYVAAGVSVLIDVEGATVIGFISPAATIITIECFE